jgi:hypothetical protein
MMSNLPSKAEVLRPSGKETETPAAPTAADEMAAAFHTGRAKPASAAE